MYNKIQINHREQSRGFICSGFTRIYVCRARLTQPSGKGGTLAYLQEWLS